MSNIKRLFRYLLPVLILPYIANLTGLLYSIGYGRLGSVYLAAHSVMLSAVSIFSTLLSLVALAGTVIPAICAESGKERPARITHTVFFCIFWAVLALLLTSMLFGERFFRLFSSPSEVSRPGSEMYALFVLAAVVVPGIACLLGQLINRYSMVLTLLVCGLGGVMIGVVGSLIPASGALAVTEGMQYALLRIAPFAMIPLRSFTQGFSEKRE